MGLQPGRCGWRGWDPSPELGSPEGGGLGTAEGGLPLGEPAPLSSCPPCSSLSFWLLPGRMVPARKRLGRPWLKGAVSFSFPFPFHPAGARDWGEEGPVKSSLGSPRAPSAGQGCRLGCGQEAAELCARARARGARWVGGRGRARIVSAPNAAPPGREVRGVCIARGV